MTTHNKNNSPMTEENLVTDKQQVGALELLAERAVINKEKTLAGKVVISKHTRSKTVNVPVELEEEVLIIKTSYESEESKDFLIGNYDDKNIVEYEKSSLQHTAAIIINGHQVQIGDEPIEIVISREVAIISKETRVIQEIEIKKGVHKYEKNVAIELSHEELDIEDNGDLNLR